MKLDTRTRTTVLTFAVFNIAWGTMLFFYHPRIPYTVISDVIPQAAWALIFSISGALLLWGGIRHHLRTAYVFMTIGLFVKSMWEVGLLFRLQDGGTPPLVLLWGLAFSIQFFSVMYFRETPHDRA